MDVIHDAATRDARRAAAREARERVEREARRSEQRRRRAQLLGGVLLASAALVLTAVLVASGGLSGDDAGSSASVGLRPGASQLEGIPQDRIVLGDPKAPITMVEYADLQCPACASFSANVLPQAIADHVRTGRVRLVFRNLHFLGPDSTRLARFAAAAGLQGRLFDVVDLVYANLGAENSGFATDGFLRAIAAGVPGLDVERALRDADSPVVDRQLAEAQRLAEADGVDGTPTVLVGPSGGTLEPVDPADLSQALQRLERQVST